MEVNTHFISQNVAAPNAHQIGVYRGNKKVGYIPLDKFLYPNIGKKLYSFGALSDIHLGNIDSDTDFQRALTYFNKIEKVDFTCICGDLTNNGTVSEYQHYKDMIDTYSPDTPVYAVTGNHDAADEFTNQTDPPLTLTNNGIEPYTGKPLFYTVSHEKDLFIMMGLRRWKYGYANDDVFSVEELQWLYDTLEANRDKRCFVFQHALRSDGCGWPYVGTWPTVKLLTSTQGTVFKSLVSHYPNVIWFHGHSHTAFDSQEDNAIANYDHNFGCHSVHIPSLAIPREYENSAYVGMTSESEGYVVDVYENHIVLRGRDFANGKFLPIATYCLNTSFMPIDAGTYTDSTGTIIVQ